MMCNVCIPSNIIEYVPLSLILFDIYIFDVSIKIQNIPNYFSLKSCLDTNVGISFLSSKVIVILLSRYSGEELVDYVCDDKVRYGMVIIYLYTRYILKSHKC